MRVVVVLEHRFYQAPDGTYWTRSVFPYEFWQRYLQVFDVVRVVARAMPVDSIKDQWQRASGPGVEFWPVPYYQGPKQYLLKAAGVKKAVQSAYLPDAAVIMRVPSRLGSLLYPSMRKHRHPYAVEVVADPWDAFAPGTFHHPLLPFFRWMGWRHLRRHCRYAAAAAYVTQNALQNRYPPDPTAFTTHYSSIELPNEAFAFEPRAGRAARRFRIVSVGSLESYYKAPDVLIDAVAQCVSRGLDLELVWVGDGKCRPELERRAANTGIADRIHFQGHVPQGSAVRAELDAADLFVLPSRTEGLPRAIIEAMARGLPCIGSDVGGIPELLPSECLVPAGNVNLLARKILDVIEDPSRMAIMSRRNLQHARTYQNDALNIRRQEFYLYVKERTQTILKKDKNADFGG